MSEKSINLVSLEKSANIKISNERNFDRQARFDRAEKIGSTDYDRFARDKATRSKSPLIYNHSPAPVGIRTFTQIGNVGSHEKGVRRHYTHGFLPGGGVYG